MLRYFTTFCIWAISQIVVGQSKPLVIPFQLTSFNNISVKAILNQKDTVQLMLHTGATDMTLTEDAVKKLKSPIFDKTIDGVKSWGGQADEVRMSEQNALTIAGFRWDSLTITENKFSGQFTDGKFGLDLFKDKFVEIDFDKKVIVLTNKLPKRHKKFQKYATTFDNGLLFLEANCEVAKDNILSNKFLIHSGYAGSLLLDDKFVADNKLGEKLTIVGEKSLKDSYGNVIKTKKATLPNLNINPHQLSDVSVGFFEGAIGRQKMSVMGGDVIKRFNWIIDPTRTVVYLKPNQNFKMPYTKV